MTRQLTIQNSDLYITFDLSLATKIGLQKWGRVLKLASQYAPGQLEGAAEYLGSIVEKCAAFYNAEIEKYMIAEVAARLGVGEKREATTREREAKRLYKELNDWKNRLGYVERHLARRSESRSA